MTREGEAAVLDGAGPASRRLERPLSRAQIGGVAAGLSEHTGLSVWVIRGVFVLVGAWQLVGLAAYLALWLVIPPASAGHAAPGVDAASRRGMREISAPTPLGARRDLGQLAAFALVWLGLLWFVQLLGWGLPPRTLAIALLMAAALGLVWWQADRAGGTARDAAEGLRGWARSLAAHWSTVAAHVLAALCLAGAVGVVVQEDPSSPPTLFAGLALLLGGIGLMSAPWVLRAQRALTQIREDKLLSDARADLAAHLHDSVLQTLALIQRQADRPREVVRLARRQERELRAWLYGSDEQAATLRAALSEAAVEIEDRFPVSVETVTVGDDPELSLALAELVKAAREAMTNAAKHSGADVIDVYAEVNEDVVEVFVRDRGQGFDLESVPEDRHGVRGSILERMGRHHGTARITSNPDRGTEVSLEMKR
ncbi:MAG: PspC domain-containing protein [Propioniciclava sp.]